MKGRELLVAREHELPIVYAVFNVARYNMVYLGSLEVYGGVATWETPPVDVAAWARSLGVQAAVIEHPGELSAESLEQLGCARAPVVLDIRIDRDLRFAGGGRNEALQRMSLLRSQRAGGQA
jgi:acetolactate synthase-1/2/3 large subunit